MEATDQSWGALEGSSRGTSSGRDEQAAFAEEDERREDTFEAKHIRLDRQAAEMLFRLAG